jgi:hypothetical protein
MTFAIYQTLCTSCSESSPLRGSQESEGCQWGVWPAAIRPTDTLQTLSAQGRAKKLAHGVIK